MRDLKPVPTAHKHKVKPFYFKSLKDGSHVFLRCEDTRALEKPYEGPFKVISRPSDKVFEINKQGKASTVTVERFKPAYLERKFEEPVQPTTSTKAPNVTVQPESIPGTSTQATDITVQTESTPISTQTTNVKVQSRPRGRPKGSTNSKNSAKVPPRILKKYSTIKCIKSRASRYD